MISYGTERVVTTSQCHMLRELGNSVVGALINIMDVNLAEGMKA